MNLLPLITRPKQNHFISPLAGRSLPTQQFQSIDKATYSTISHLDGHSTKVKGLGGAKTEHKLKLSGMDGSLVSSRKLSDNSTRLMRMYRTIDSPI